MSDPYRASSAPLARATPAELLPGGEPPPSSLVAVRARSDGSTEVRIASAHYRPRFALGLFGAILALTLAWASALPAGWWWVLGPSAALACVGAHRWLARFAEERITVTPSALLVQRRVWPLRAVETRLLDEVSTVAFDEREVRDPETQRARRVGWLEILAREQRIRLADDFGLDEESLRWVMHELRAALERARQSRAGGSL